MSGPRRPATRRELPSSEAPLACAVAAGEVRPRVGHVEGLLAAEAAGRPLRERVGALNITGDAAPLVLAALRRVFPELDRPPS